MSASHIIPEHRNLKARVKISFSELFPQQSPFLNSKLTKGAVACGRHIQFTLGLKLQCEVFINKVKSQ